VDDLGIVESANDLEDAIDGTYVREECVSKPGTCRCASREASNIYACQVGRDARGGLVKLA